MRIARSQAALRDLPLARRGDDERQQAAIAIDTQATTIAQKTPR